MPKPVDNTQSPIDNPFMLRLYCPDLRTGNLELSPEEAHHAVAALRAKVGDPVTLFDGQGREGTGSIVGITKRQVVVEIGDIRTREFDCQYRLTIAIALGKAHRQSYVIEKCTELGVAAIWPMITERSVTKPREAAVEKWSRRAIEAAKQSGRAFVPTISDPQTLPAVLARASEFDASAIADVANPSRDREVSDPPWRGAIDPSRDCEGTIKQNRDREEALHNAGPSSRNLPAAAGGSVASSLPILDFLAARPRHSTILCLIGPEGGWSDAEREAARAANLTVVILSRTILRTETAAVTACAAAALTVCSRESRNA